MGIDDNKITMSDSKFVLNLCPTGVVPTKAMSPYVPLSPAEVARDVRECLELGISSIHLHARDSEGKNSSLAKIYAEFIAAVRTESEEIVICVSCSGRINPDLESRSEVLSLKGDLKPDMGSLTLGSLNFARSVSTNSSDVIIGLAKKMQDKGIKPELEIFDIGMMNYASYLIQKGYLDPPFLFNFILGNPFTAQADPLQLGALIKQLPNKSIWTVGGIGNYQTSALALGLASGGGTRVGLEDNIWLDSERTTPATNSALVKRCVDIAAHLERSPMSPNELRLLMDL
jgi:uncharacterized protein (DUF849 family)